MRHRLRRYVGAHLHRQLFSWFGAIIFVAMAATALLVHAIHLAEARGPRWGAVGRGALAFVAGRFADVWEDAAARQALAEELAGATGLGVQLLDGAGERLASVGTCEGWSQSTPLRRGAEQVGAIRICVPRDLAGGPPWHVLLPVLVVAMVLWAGTGKVARRLSRPLVEVTRVAREIGAGRLASRASLGRRDTGELRQLAWAINDMAAKLERQLTDQRTLLAVVSHELRTPLARLRVLVELAREAQAWQPSLWAGFEREVADIDALVGELLASARLDFTAVAPQALTAAAVARQALERAGVAAELLDDGLAGDGRLRADPTLLARALANLLENARKHGAGVARLRLRRDGAHTVFEVDDRGPGVPEDAGPLFAMFHRGPDADARDPTSLGLGLALVRRIAEAHGGRAFAGNAPGGGARIGFSVRTEGPGAPP
jgi:two-component system OmpR family sensor kinase